ncbi:25S rRNA (adenine2142-N1)-methyltransferase [Coemansia sp. RSA 552]|nr:25S rRNA (adenine2142-N1)-methyltransferase [Coemansia sp. RSA 552]
MAKANSKRRRPVTAQRHEAAAALALPPIHVAGQDKIHIDVEPLDRVARGKLGKSSAETRRRINHFHTLIKEYSKLGARRSQLADLKDIAETEAQIQQIAEEMARMGGLDWYQKASLLGQSKRRGGDTSRWLVPKLRDLGLHQRKDGKLRLLDVGALSCLNYAQERAWIDVVPIDLNSQEPGIRQLDFLDIEIGPEPPVAGAGPDDEDSASSSKFHTPFDVVCLSLVVNFIGDPAKRGDMLRQGSRILASGGYLFLVLPRSCVDNSRYMDDDRLLAIMQSLGFTQVASHHTAKLAHYLYRLDSAPPTGDSDEQCFKKKMLHSAPGRNNFSIVV